MEHSSAIIKILLFLTFSLHLSSAGTHSLHVLHTVVTPGINFPEFTAFNFVDGEQTDYYDSNLRQLIPRTEWIKEIDADDPDYWKRNTEILQDVEEIFKVDVLTLMELFNQTKGVHVKQVMYGCEFDDDDTIRGYEEHGYDGEDFLSFDLKTGTYTALNELAINTKHDWESSGYANYTKSYLEIECISWLKTLLSYGRDSLERKDRPEVSMFHKRSNSSELVCHATGYFPRGLMIFWEKDGEELLEDVEIRATVPNPDGTFQKRAVLRVSPEDQQKHRYTCVVQHSSQEKDLVLPASGSVDVGEGSLGAGAIVGIVLAVVAGVSVVVAAGVLIWKKKMKSASRFSSSPLNSDTSSTSS
ncbi:BOLA class I histocompatibility antigen, alpha chain BL3-7-like [Trichomycterus rosablanca]|uniref:BOLA class I histocompatibility antigen, alpha chain BL3-7-like n=1 Tax=Trichomycterus rosablanca TaxID=2290929 RepID=UPI002F359381